VGRVSVGSTDVNAALVQQGAAWVYRQYAHDSRLVELEQQAQAARRGLWALPKAQRIPPWEWRRATKQEREQASRANNDTLFSRLARLWSGCGDKRTCGEMTDCAEARHYLDDCDIKRLDRNGDGIPCESLCP
jgi:hypothetical protein